MKYNHNLVTIKCVLFLFFGGIGLLLSFLPLHMESIGLNLDESRIISIVAPCISLIGPFIVGPLADKLAGNNGSGGTKQTRTGRYLRVMIAACFILTAIFYSFLMLIPSVERSKANSISSVKFVCNSKGGIVLQERCKEDRQCNHRDDEKIGTLLLSKCQYACHVAPENLLPSSPPLNTYIENNNNSKMKYNLNYNTRDYDHNSVEGSSDDGLLDEESEESLGLRKQRSTVQDLEPPPHLCYKDQSGHKFCQVYTELSLQINPNVTLMKAINGDADEENWCRYPVGMDFSCEIVPAIVGFLKNISDPECQAVVECDVEHPYDDPNSVLADSKCIRTTGDPLVTFWSYLVLRSIADIFPTAAIALLDAAVVIATRETSSGRGDVGRQLAWGALGFGLFAPLVGLISDSIEDSTPFPAYSTAIIVCVVLMLIATCIILLSTQMPLSPPEWWWHTRSGMVAMPMSEVKYYGFEIAALLGVLILLGILWSAIDSYLPWHLTELEGSQFLIGLTLLLGAIPAVPFLWNAEKVVDYCGHSNLLITAFTFYIIRFVGLASISNPWWSLLLEALEVFTLALMWVTAILYLRHLVPRRFTVTGQAAAVAVHFCIGRCIGALIGGLLIDSEQNTKSIQAYQEIYRYLAIISAIIATIYFILYHAFFKPRYTAPTAQPPRQLSTVTQGFNSNGTNNGSYTPLRVYHNGRAKKGQFRY